MNLANAALFASVQHFVYSSVGSAYGQTGIPHFDSKWEVEEHIRSLALPYTIVRPVALMENWEAQRKDILGGHCNGHLTRRKSSSKFLLMTLGL